MRINDFCTFAPKSAIKAGDATDTGEYMFFTSSADESKRYCEYQLNGEGIIMGTGGNATLHYYSGKYAVSTDCVVLLPDERISCKFLYYFLLANMNLLEAGFKGAGLKHTNKKYIGNIEITEVPSKGKQQEIVKVMDKVSSCIKMYQAQLTKLDELVKARFVEMFGDPILNPKNFPCYTVGDIIEFQGGSQPDKKFFEYEATPDNIRLIQIRDYKSDKYITYIPKSMAKRFCTADDIMIGRYGPPIFQILKGIEGSFNVALMKATPKMGNREFIRQFLKQECLFNYLEGLSKRTAGQDGIQMDKLKAYPFPYPPLPLQNQFATFVEEVDKSKLLVGSAAAHETFDIGFFPKSTVQRPIKEV